MATPLAYTAHYALPAAKVRAALSDEQYWTTRLAEVGGPGAHLDSFTSDGTRLKVEMIQSIPAADLPSQITAVRPGDLIIPRAENYDGDAGTFHARVEGAPAQVQGTVTLTGDDNSATVTVAGTVEVAIPLFGKKIEAAVAEKLTELLAREAEFTGTWVAAH